jgi:hypothetical protein
MLQRSLEVTLLGPRPVSCLSLVCGLGLQSPELRKRAGVFSLTSLQRSLEGATPRLSLVTRAISPFGSKAPPEGMAYGSVRRSLARRQHVVAATASTLAPPSGRHGTRRAACGQQPFQDGRARLDGDQRSLRPPRQRSFRTGVGTANTHSLPARAAARSARLLTSVSIAIFAGRYSAASGHGTSPCVAVIAVS